MPVDIILEDKEPEDEGLNAGQNAARPTAMLNESELQHRPVVELKGLTFPTGRKIPIGVAEEKLFQVDGQLHRDGLTFHTTNTAQRFGHENSAEKKIKYNPAKKDLWLEFLNTIV